MQKSDVVVIGAGAAGFFAAIQAATHFPSAKIVILERGVKPLAKVKISGGGRCNVTNVISEPAELARNYPRGERFLKKAFYQFSSTHMIDWLAKKGIELKLYPDGCYFPVSNSSQTIIDCFMDEIRRLKISLNLNQRVESIEKVDDGWEIRTPDETYVSRSIILTTGGQPKISGFDLLKKLDLKIVDPLPSLFTLNMPDEPIKELMGIVKEEASVKIAGEKWNASGPLLITHWGMSGPAVLKTSAFGARILASKNYESLVLVNWTGELKQSEILEELNLQKSSAKLVVNVPQLKIKARLWEYLTQKCGIPSTMRWNELTPKHFNRLSECLFADTYKMQGKTTFKEEFVTAGGIDLSEINVQTMEAKRFPGLFFSGEVMDIDGVTGGFNFQAAWTTAYIAGKSVLKPKSESN